MKKHTLFIVLIIGAALSIGIWRDNQDEAIAAKQFSLGPALSTGSALSEPQNLPSINLLDMDGLPFTNQSLKDRWSFVFFGYSSCPDVCPKTLGALKQISERLHGGDHVQYLFVSIDPEHDTPAHLKQYFEGKFDESFIGLTGDKADIQKLAAEIGIHFAKAGMMNPDEHIEHSGSILLINPEGRLAAIFSSSEKPHAIAHDFKQLAHYYAKAGA